MAEWDGRGLPPAAQARIGRAASGTTRTSLLPAAGLAAIEHCGFEICGEVLGCTVLQIGWYGYRGCGSYGFANPGVQLSGQGYRWAGFTPYVSALRGGRRTALHRMAAEASALGADGVIGVTLQQVDVGSSMHEFMALGTAIRSKGRVRPATQFTTDLGGQDVAKLYEAGWVPSALTSGISLGIRHDDYQTRRQVSPLTGPGEVPGYTQLISTVRADARLQFARQVAETGADAALLSDLSMRVFDVEPSDGHRDWVAECVLTGTSIVQFHRGAAAPTRSLTILPLTGRGGDR
ncbi:MAG: hypothetical protein JWO79_4948 [Actinomycetia bacterium]|nr:hypothetical protein [Actinomycetes bacterium]MDQ1651225.1 hypothetical protein [Cryptosporangiaceae bacterium]